MIPRHDPPARAHWHLYGYALAVVLAGCDDANLDDLRAFVELAPADTVPQAAVVDDPRATAAESTVIARNPFERASRSAAGVAQANGPDPTRTPEPLEQHPLGRLQMVGTLAGRGALYALVRDPNGQTHRVTAGDHLGRDNGRIVAVHGDRVELVELVTDGTGWRRRPRSLAMETGDPASNDGGGLRE